MFTSDEYAEFLLARFERISRVIHHICDVLDIHILNAKGEDESIKEFLNEKLFYRKTMISLVSRSITLIQRMHTLITVSDEAVISAYQSTVERNPKNTFMFSPPPKRPVAAGAGAAAAGVSESGSNSIASPGNAVDRNIDRRFQERQLNSLIIMLLKRKAESGNDLFQSSTTDSGYYYVLISSPLL
jgi:hypothetical protein